MKQLLFILMFAGLTIQAQEVQIDYRVYGTLDTFDITTVDTAWQVDYLSTFTTYKGPWSGTVQFYWTEFVGTMDGTMRMQGSSDKGVNWEDLNMATYSITDTVGSHIFHITTGVGAHYDITRMYFDRNLVTGGKIIPSVRIFKYK
jgi:hypothetical protein